MVLLATLTLALVATISAKHIHPHHHKHIPRLLTCRHSLLTTSTAISRPSPAPAHIASHEHNVSKPSKPPARSKNRSFSSTSFTPNSNKAGIAGGDAYPIFKDHIGWWYDWSPTPSKPSSPGPTPLAVPMLWGGGTADGQDAQRLSAFTKLSKSISSLSIAPDTIPPFVLGFEEPDCESGFGSAGMSITDAVEKWESLMAPMKRMGVKLGSPSMCKQADETWLSEFKSKIKTDWDFTAIHVNKNNLDGVKKDIDHYLSYGKPIWVTEFACVNDVNGFVPCTHQDEINNYIHAVVPFFESHRQIFAYAYSNGLGLGDVWPLIAANGELSESGKTYLQAVRQYH